jgi:glycosyltransferase involved in cell wall biosynthesis
LTLRIGFNTLYEDPNRPTGSHEQNLQLVNWLSQLGTEHALVLFVSPANAVAFERGDRIEHVNCFTSNEHRLGRIAAEQTLLPLQLALRRCDVLVAPGNTCPVWTPCPVVLHIKTMEHALDTEGIGLRRKTFRSVMIAGSARQASAIIANSPDNREQIIHHLRVPPEKVHLIPEGLDHDHFKPPADRERLQRQLEAEGLASPFVLFVSGLWPYKNVEILISAFERLRSRGLPHRLLIVGEGYDWYRDRLLAQVRKAGLQREILFLGRKPKEDVARLMQAADALALPSTYESFGRVLTEAMACGTPVVAARASCLPEVVEDAGLLIRPRDPDELADGLAAVVSDTRLRHDLVERGLRRAAEFSWERTARLTLSVIESVTRHRGGQEEAAAESRSGVGR